MPAHRMESFRGERCGSQPKIRGPLEQALRTAGGLPGLGGRKCRLAALTAEH